MPMIIRDIRNIAKEKKRDVLFVGFDFKLLPIEEKEKSSSEWAIRKQLMSWLDERAISYEPCDAPYPNQPGFGEAESWYHGQLYIDVPWSENNEQFKIVSDHFENTDGSFKIPGIGFYAVQYSEVLALDKNSEDDEEGLDFLFET